MANVLMAPSILSADFARLGEEVAAIEAAGADMVHVDVMDGHYVPNLTIGPMVVKALRAHARIPFDVHLMIAPVDPFVTAFREAGANIISFHPDAGPHPHRTLQAIQAGGAKAGLVYNPGAPLSGLEAMIDLVDLVLIMSVNPGFGGQTFIESSLRKIEAARAMIDRSGREIILEVDGGVNAETAPRVIAAGATALVAGAAVFRGDPAKYRANIASLRIG
jgi:ribulose-phosphate 3-epimerase